MSKSKRKYKWLDEEDYYPADYINDREHDKKLQDRRKMKKMKSAIKTKDINYLSDLVEDEQ